MARTILVVDDEPVVIEITKRKLEQMGLLVNTACDGEEALASVKMQKPDLIVLDIQMPRMNGYTFMMEFRKMPEFAEVPIIVLTAYNEMEPLFKRHGVKAYLLKPLKLQDLLDKVQAVLGESDLAQ